MAATAAAAVVMVAVVEVARSGNFRVRGRGKGGPEGGQCGVVSKRAAITDGGVLLPIVVVDNVGGVSLAPLGPLSHRGDITLGIRVRFCFMYSALVKGSIHI